MQGFNRNGHMNIRINNGQVVSQQNPMSAYRPNSIELNSAENTKTGSRRMGNEATLRQIKTGSNRDAISIIATDTSPIKVEEQDKTPDSRLSAGLHMQSKPTLKMAAFEPTSAKSKLEVGDGDIDG